MWSGRFRRPARPITSRSGARGKPSEIAELACFLASDRSSYLSGGDFVCDGGRMANLLGRPRALSSASLDAVKGIRL